MHALLSPLFQPFSEPTFVSLFLRNTFLQSIYHSSSYPQVNHILQSYITVVRSGHFRWEYGTGTYLTFSLTLQALLFENHHLSFPFPSVVIHNDGYFYSPFKSSYQSTDSLWCYAVQSDVVWQTYFCGIDHLCYFVFLRWEKIKQEWERKRRRIE